MFYNERMKSIKLTDAERMIITEQIREEVQLEFEYLKEERQQEI